MTAANLDSADLKTALSAPGLLNEDVMEKIWQIDDYILEFSGRCGSSSVSNAYTEWTTLEMAVPDVNNAVVDGSDATGNNTKLGTRLGNQCQESVKVVRVSDRADASDGIGSINTLSKQLSQRQIELRRDVEAISLSLQGSTADDGAATAGKSSSAYAYLVTNINAGATGTHTGFNSATKVVAAATAGTKRALTETLIRDCVQNIFLQTGRNRQRMVMMARPEVIRLIDTYLFTSTARVATIQRRRQRPWRGGRAGRHVQGGFRLSGPGAEYFAADDGDGDQRAGDLEFRVCAPSVPEEVLREGTGHDRACGKPHDCCGLVHQDPE
jgi:hypothetical protein